MAKSSTLSLPQKYHRDMPDWLGSFPCFVSINEPHALSAFQHSTLTTYQPAFSRHIGYKSNTTHEYTERSNYGKDQSMCTFDRAPRITCILSRTINRWFFIVTSMSRMLIALNRSASIELRWALFNRVRRLKKGLGKSLACPSTGTKMNDRINCRWMGLDLVMSGSEKDKYIALVYERCFLVQEYDEEGGYRDRDGATISLMKRH